MSNRQSARCTRWPWVAVVVGVELLFFREKTWFSERLAANS